MTRDIHDKHPASDTGTNIGRGKSKRGPREPDTSARARIEPNAEERMLHVKRRGKVERNGQRANTDHKDKHKPLKRHSFFIE